LGFAASRFSDPRTKPPSHFAVYYVGKSVEVASLETIVCDLRRGNPGPLLLSSQGSNDDAHVHVAIGARLDLVDSGAGNAVAPAC
jgi:hypothetical protein